MILEKQYKHTKLHTMVACALAFGSGSAVAQEETGSFALEEIIVTAQKRAESLADIPIAVSAFDQQLLTDKGLLGGPDLQLAIPNVTFRETGFGVNNFQIRGIGAQIQGNSADVGVGVHLNNIPLTVNRLANAELYDVERVEVLRGPQGTLYGRNATGGVINMLTAKPSDEFSSKVTLELGNYSTSRLTGHVNIPVSETLAVRAAGTLINRDGTINNVGTGNDVENRDIMSTRLSASWTPSDSLTATVMWEHFEQDDSAGGKRKIICNPIAGPTQIGGVPTNPFTQAVLAPGCEQNQAEDPSNNGVTNNFHTIPGMFAVLFGLSPQINPYANTIVSNDLHTIDSFFDPLNQSDADIYSLDISYEITPELTLSSITSYNEDNYYAAYPVTGTSASAGLVSTPFSPGGVVSDAVLGSTTSIASGFLLPQVTEQFTQELRLQSSFDGKFNYSVGGIYVDLERTNQIIALSPITNAVANIQNAVFGAGIYVDNLETPDGTGHNYFNNASVYQLEASALFGEVYYDVSDTVKATLGLRYTEDNKTQTAFPVQFLAPGRGFPPTEAEEVTFKETTGRLTIDWKPSDDLLVYGSYSKGYKGGGFNPSTNETLALAIPTSFEPEFVNSFEVGIKNSFADGRGSLNLTGFIYEYEDYQISRLVAQSVINENIDADIKGIELEGTFLATENLKLDAQIGYLNTKITNGTSINEADLLQGRPGFTVVNSIDPASFSARCIVPTEQVIGLQGAINAGFAPSEAMASLCSGPFASPFASTGVPVELSGNELPDAPEWTVSLGAEYTMQVTDSWEGIARLDYYRQAENFGTIYNATYDKVKSWDNLNLSYRFINDDNGLEVQLYARNLLSEDSITSIEIGTPTIGDIRYVSGKERPMYGVRISKNW